jgi:two-component system cell cycle sensor histidine kinase/response regulator CckA
MPQSQPGASAENELQSLRRRVSELESRLARGAGGPSENETLLAAAEKVVHLGSWSLDLETGAVKWSDELFRIFGLDPKTDQATPEKYFAALHPDELRASLDGMSRLKRDGVLEPRETRVMRPDGTWRRLWAQGAVTRRAEDGRPLHAVGTMLDVTEIRDKERELRNLAGLLQEAQNIAKVGSWVWNPATAELEWSDELCRIFGVEPGFKPTVDIYFSMLHPDDFPRHKDAREKALAAGFGGPVELRIIRPDGEIRHVQVRAKRMEGPQGGSGDGRFLGTCWDITERKRLEEQLRQSQKLEAVGRLAAGVAHDFNNLLSIIAGNTELLLAENPDEKLRRISDTADVGAALTRRLLALSRQSLVRPAALDLNQAVSETARVLEGILGEHVEVDLDLRAEPAVVLADLGQIQQVILNLSINARDAMPSGGNLLLATARVTAPPAEAWEANGARPRAQDGAAAAARPDLAARAGAGWLRFTVRDTGTGMDPATLARAFEPFFTTKEDKGTGLGLSTVIDLIEQSGGRIAVESAVGHGTAVTVYLPAHAGEAPRKSKPAEEVPGGHESVLVVEDHPALRELIKCFLEDGGYRVQAVGRPREAEILFDREAPGIDLLVTDLVMPGKSGHSLAQGLAARKPSLKVLYISGYDSASGPGKSVDGLFLQKPFTRNELLLASRAALDGKAIAGKGLIS